MIRWLRSQWAAYVASYDADVVAAATAPGGIVVVGLSLVLVFASLAYLPFFQEIGGFDKPTVAIVLALLGSVSSSFSRWKRCRGPVGETAALFDHVFYSGSLAVAAVYTRGELGATLAGIYCLVVVLFPARYYGQSLIMGTAMGLPIIVLFAMASPSPAVALILACGLVLAWTAASYTDNRRKMLAREKQLNRALDVADRIADESHQAALTTTLLSLGHFLHELRNYQTAISGNLSFLSSSVQLSEACTEALNDAVDVQQQQETLVRGIIRELTGRAQSSDTSFQLGRVLDESAADFPQLEFTMERSSVDFEVQGNPEYLRIVLLNLLRNAVQAEARHLRVSVVTDPSGQSAQVRIQDDGAGIPEAMRDGIFGKFSQLSRSDGTGLGLYLVRRYMELLGGSASLADSRKGTCVLLRIPVGKLPGPF